MGLGNFCYPTEIHPCNAVAKIVKFSAAHRIAHREVLSFRELVIRNVHLNPQLPGLPGSFSEWAMAPFLFLV
jgi:hypothetical protein